MRRAFKVPTWLIYVLLIWASIYIGATCLRVIHQNQNSDASRVERLCQTAADHVDCHPNISPEISQATLINYESRVSTVKARNNKVLFSPGSGGQVQNIPPFWDLPLTFSDRIKAFRVSGGLTPEIADVPVSATDNTIRTATGIGRFVLVLIIALSLMGVVPVIMATIRRAQLRRAGFIDLKAAYNTHRGKYLASGTAIAVLVFFVFAALHLLILGLVLSILVIMCSLTAANNVWKEQPDRLGVINRFQRPPPPRPQARGEHGGARHAADAELHAKGFAEREEPSAPSATEIDAQLNSMSKKEREDFAERLGAEFIPLGGGRWQVRQKGFRA